MKKIKRKSSIKLRPGDVIILRGGLKLENTNHLQVAKINDFQYFLLNQKLVKPPLTIINHLINK